MEIHLFHCTQIVQPRKVQRNVPLGHTPPNRGMRFHITWMKINWKDSDATNDPTKDVFLCSLHFSCIIGNRSTNDTNGSFSTAMLVYRCVFDTTIKGPHLLSFSENIRSLLRKLTEIQVILCWEEARKHPRELWCLVVQRSGRIAVMITYHTPYPPWNSHSPWK